MQTVFQKQLFLDNNDFDPRNVWKPASWFWQMQHIGTEQCDKLGYGEEWLERNGFFWAVIRSKFVMEPQALSLKIGVISGETWHNGVVGVLWRREYEFFAPTGERIGGASALWALIDRKNRSILRPNAFPKDFPQEPSRLALERAPHKLKHNDLPFIEERTVRYAELDANGHVNNSRYVEWIIDALPVGVRQSSIVESVQLDFRMEMLFGQNIRLCGAPDSEDHHLWHFSTHNQDQLCFQAEVRIK